VAVLSSYKHAEERRRPGLMKGKLWMADDFHAVDDGIADLFEGAGPNSAAFACSR